jgi:hypothetical protein
MTRTRQTGGDTVQTDYLGSQMKDEWGEGKTVAVLAWYKTFPLVQSFDQLLVV